MTTQTLSFDTLQAGIRGSVLTPDDDGFDAARSVYNAMIDRHPAVIVRARDAADVMAAIRFAREHDLELAVRGGSHSARATVPPTAAWCSTWANSARSGSTPPPAGPGSAAGRCSAISTTPPTPSAWPRRPASTRPPAWAA